MRCKMAYLLVFTLIASFGWSAHQHIECTIKPIDRSKIHPQESSASGNVSSTNWSGYVAAPSFQSAVQGSVTYVTGSWIVPTLIATADATYSAIWVGIDGYLDPTVEQIGTSHNWANGKQQNYAWFEMYPGGSYEINGFPVDDGDLINASVQYVGSNEFQMTLTNHTKSVTTNIPLSYTTSATAKRNSAEWIVEAPYSGMILSLSDFHLATLTNCFATVKGVTGSINDMLWANEMITMQSGQVVKAKPTSLMNNGTGFQVAWEHQ